MSYITVGEIFSAQFERNRKDIWGLLRQGNIMEQTIVAVYTQKWRDFQNNLVIITRVKQRVLFHSQHI